MKASYTVPEASDLLNISKRTVYRMIENKTLGKPKEGRVCGEIFLKITDDKLMKPSKLAKLFDVSQATIYRWFWEDKIQGVKLGKTIRIFVTSVEEFIFKSVDYS